MYKNCFKHLYGMLEPILIIVFHENYNMKKKKWNPLLRSMIKGLFIPSMYFVMIISVRWHLCKCILISMYQFWICNEFKKKTTRYRKEYFSGKFVTSWPTDLNQKLKCFFSLDRNTCQNNLSFQSASFLFSLLFF